MGIPITNIPVPATPGAAGASVDISGLSTIISVINPFAKDDDNVNLQMTYDPAGLVGWQNIASFVNGKQMQVLEVEAPKIRALRVNGSGGAYNIQAAGQQAGAGTTFNLAVPATGNSASQDISGQPPVLSLFFDGATGSLAQLQCSLDGANFVPFGFIQPGQNIEVTCGCNNLIAARLQGGTAGTLRGAGIPLKG